MPLAVHPAHLTMPLGGNREVTLLDYGAGNVRSVRNAIRKLGYSIKEVSGVVAAGSPSQGCATLGSSVLALLGLCSSPSLLTMCGC